jgi:hypothetical protein
MHQSCFIRQSRPPRNPAAILVLPRHSARSYALFGLDHLCRRRLGGQGRCVEHKTVERHRLREQESLPELDVLPTLQHRPKAHMLGSLVG